MKALCVTIPKSIKWTDYMRELNVVKDWSQDMNFKVSSIPRDIDSIERCYLCHDGQILGWMKITGYVRDYKFKCSTTGEEWSGNFIQRSGPFHYLEEPIPCKGFMGYKYIDVQD